MTAEAKTETPKKADPSKDDAASKSCPITLACICKMLCEDPDKPQKDAEKRYRNSLAPEFANETYTGPKSYRMRSLDGSRMVEEEDKWDTQAYPKSYSMRSTCF